MFTKKRSKLGQKGSRWGYVTHFWNFGTPKNISGTVKAGNFKFDTEKDDSEYNKKCKIESIGVTSGHATHLLNFGTP